MALRSKTIALIGLTIAALLLTLYSLTQTILLDSYAELEHVDLRRNVTRAVNALSAELTALDSTTFDWATWDDAHKYVTDGDPEFARSNLVDNTFTTHQLNFLIYLKNDGSVVNADCYDLNTDTRKPIPPDALAKLTAAPMLNHQKLPSSISGVILLPEHPVMVASRPVITSKEEGPIVGTLIMGRYLNKDQIEALSSTTQLTIELDRIDKPTWSSELKTATSNSEIAVHPQGDDVISGYTTVNGALGEPVLVLCVKQNRSIYAQGKTAVTWFAIALLATGVVFGIVVLALLESQVLARVTRLSRHVTAIGSQRELTARVQVTGNDEITRLSQSINQMLESLERGDRQQRKLEDNLAQAQRLEALATLTGGIGHDFNNLLTAIIGHAGNARGTLPDGHPANRSLQMIEYASEQATRVTQSLLTFTDEQSTDKSPVDLAATIADILELLKHVLPGSVEVFNHANDKAWINGDALQIQRILINLAMNARDAMPDGGSLHFDLSQDNGRATITVEDTGCGMSAETRAQVFEPFFTTKSRGQGTGLGLSVAHGIITDHGGQIEIDSQPDKGTRFTIVFPTCDAPQPVEKIDKSSEPKHSSGKGTVILAEDNDMVRDVMVDTLESAGFRVRQATDGMAATREFDEHAKDAVLAVVDLDLPKKPGLACIDHLRQTNTTLPVILVTGYTDQIPKNRSTEHEIVLAKPFKLNQFLQAVGEAIDVKDQSAV